MLQLKVFRTLKASLDDSPCCTWSRLWGRGRAPAAWKHKQTTVHTKTLINTLQWRLWLQVKMHACGLELHTSLDAELCNCKAWMHFQISEKQCKKAKWVQVFPQSYATKRKAEQKGDVRSLTSTLEKPPSHREWKCMHICRWLLTPVVFVLLLLLLRLRVK